MTTGVGGTGDYVSLIEGGVEVLRADGGKVGIGTSPANALHVLHSDAIQVLVQNSGNADASIAVTSAIEEFPTSR